MSDESRAALAQAPTLGEHYCEPPAKVEKLWLRDRERSQYAMELR